MFIIKCGIFKHFLFHSTGVNVPNLDNQTLDLRLIMVKILQTEAIKFEYTAYLPYPKEYFLDCCFDDRVKHLIKNTYYNFVTLELTHTTKSTIKMINSFQFCWQSNNNHFCEILSSIFCF